jgi:type IV pilus assembly protein PilQ
MRNRTMSTRILLTAIAALALSAQGLAQPAPAPAAAPPAAEPAKIDAVSVQGTAPAASSVTRDKDTLSVDFPDEEIKTILRNVADLFELNLVVPDTLTGKTSIKLRDVTWRQIFHVVLSPAGYTYIEEGNIIKIVSNESLTQEPGTTEVFILNNAKAADIKPTVDGLVDAATGGKILVDARSNALIVTERPSKMGRIRTIIDQLDKATDQVMIESKFIEVTDGDIRNLGVNWSSLGGYNVGAGPFAQNYVRAQSNGLATTNTGTNTNVAYMQAQQAAAGQVVGAPGPLGLTPTYVPDPRFPGTPGLLPSDPGYVAPVYDVTYPGFGGASSVTQTLSELVTHSATAVFNADAFNVVLSALNTLSNTKVVSNPTIVTLNNTEAFINIGQEYPIPSYTYNSERGSFEVSGFQYKPIGIILKVTPQVNARGIIKLALEPEVSQTNGTTTFGGAGGASIPIIATRKAKTQVSLKDGYTMGIGGLILNQQQHGGTKVPLLGDIPGLGRLFSSKTVNDTSTNLLIFITAKTLSADGASAEEVFDPRAIQATGINKDDLPGYRAAKGTNVYAAPAAKMDDK